MFCAKCGQEQASEYVRFCSRCGLKLGNSEEDLAKHLIKMAMYIVLAICAISGWGSITAGPGYMQIRFIVTLIAVITFYLLFSGDLKLIFKKLLAHNIEQNELASATQQTALPAAQSIPSLSVGSHPINTAEMVQPPSVTEQTTGLLDKDKH